MNRVGQTWSNTRDLFLCVESCEVQFGVWKHVFVELDDAGTHVFEESEAIDWTNKDLSYWRRIA